MITLIFMTVIFLLLGLGFLMIGYLNDEVNIYKYAVLFLVLATVSGCFLASVEMKQSNNKLPPTLSWE